MTKTTFSFLLIYAATSFAGVEDVVRKQTTYWSTDRLNFITLPEFCPRENIALDIPGSHTNWWANVQSGRVSRCWSVWSNGVLVADNMQLNAVRADDLDVGFAVRLPVSPIDRYLDIGPLRCGGDFYYRNLENVRALGNDTFDISFYGDPEHFAEETRFYLLANGPWDYHDISEDGIGMFAYRGHKDSVDYLSAFYSIYNAYRERLYFASQGQSNEWDRAEWGPDAHESFDWSVSNSVCNHAELYLNLQTNEEYLVSWRYLEWTNLCSLVWAVKDLYPLSYNGTRATNHTAFVYRPGWILSDPDAMLWWATTAKFPECYDSMTGEYWDGIGRGFLEFDWLAENAAITNFAAEWKYVLPTLDMMGPIEEHQSAARYAAPPPAYALWDKIREIGIDGEFDVDKDVPPYSGYTLKDIVTGCPSPGYLGAKEWLAKHFYPMSAWEIPKTFTVRQEKSCQDLYNSHVWGDPGIRTDSYQYVGPCQYLALMDSTYEIPSSHIEVTSNDVIRYHHKHKLSLVRNFDEISYDDLFVTNRTIRLKAMINTGDDTDYERVFHEGDTIASFAFGDENYDVDPETLRCERYFEDLGQVEATGFGRETVQVGHSTVDYDQPNIALGLKLQRPVMMSDLLSAMYEQMYGAKRMSNGAFYGSNNWFRVYFAGLDLNSSVDTRRPYELLLFIQDMYDEDHWSNELILLDLANEDYKFAGNLTTSNETVYLDRHYDIYQSSFPKFVHGPIQPGDFSRGIGRTAYMLMAASYWLDHGEHYFGHDFRSPRYFTYGSVKGFEDKMDMKLSEMKAHMMERLDEHENEYCGFGFLDDVRFAQQNDILIKANQDFDELTITHHEEHLYVDPVILYDPKTGKVYESKKALGMYAWTNEDGELHFEGQFFYEWWNPFEGCMEYEQIYDEYGEYEDSAAGQLTLWMDELDDMVWIDCESYPKQFFRPSTGESRGNIKSLLGVKWDWESLIRNDPE